MFRRSAVTLASLILLTVAPQCAHAVQYRVTAVGQDVQSVPSDIGESGEIAGSFYYPGDEYIPGRAATFGPDGSTQELPNGADCVMSAALGINAGGQVVGYTATLYPSSINRACAWTAESIRLLETPFGYSSSRAIRISDLGLIVGNASSGSFDSQACLWDSGGVHGLGMLAGDLQSDATDVNNRGEIIGCSYVGARDYSYDPIHAFIRDSAGVMQDMGTIRNSLKTFPTAINNYGQLTGYCTNNYSTGDGGSTSAFVWDRRAGFREIPMLPGATGNRAFGINDRGQVIGACDYCPISLYSRAFLWDEMSGLQDLGALFPDPCTWPVAINNSGQILIRHGQFAYNQPSSASLLTPIPVPSPTINITWPSSEPVIETCLAEMNISGNASDFFGIESIHWSTNRGGYGTCVGKEYWTAVAVPVPEGTTSFCATSLNKANAVRQDTVTINRVPTVVGKAKGYLQKRVCVRDAAVTATNIEAGSVFVESSDRSSGIRLITDRQLQLGDRVSFIATIANANGDYQGRDVVFTDVTAGKPLRPMLMNSLALVNNPVPDQGRHGLDTTNMLVTMAGKVKQIINEDRVVYINDVGDYAHYSGDCAEGVRVHIPEETPLPSLGQTLIATGILRLDDVGFETSWMEYQSSIWPRSTADVAVR